MFIHTVMWKLRDDVDGEPAFQELKLLLEGLVAKIPELESLELGYHVNTDEAAWDLVLRSSHRDQAAFKQYRNHPEHLAAVKKMVSLVKDRAVVDYVRM